MKEKTDDDDLYNNISNRSSTTASTETTAQTQLPFSQALPIHPSYSILNVTIDYVMTAPTPFEWMEFEKMASTSRSSKAFKTRVPVIRIFGPLLKHTSSVDAKSPKRRNTVPRQSGCVHIHNVFPYFLARPQFCMLSLLSTQTNNLSNNQSIQKYDHDDPFEALDLFRSTAAFHIDWDNYESIESSLYTLKHYLELSCIDVYLANRTTSTINATSKEYSTNSTPDFIRDISVWYVK
jgi:hypothetical protein